MQIEDFAPIKYWTEETTPPLFGITDKQMPPCNNDFLCIFKDNTVLFYYINGRHEREIKEGFEYFSNKNFIKDYSEKVQEVLNKLNSLKTEKFSLMDLIKISRKANGVYDMSEAVRLKKFEEDKDAEVWDKFRVIAELRLKMREELETLYKHTDKALNELAEKNNITRDDLFFYTYDELKKLFNEGKKVNSGIINERKKGYIYWIKNKKSNLITGKQFRELAEKFSNLQNKQDLQEISGRVVWGEGTIKGRAQIILHNKKNLDSRINKFKEGRILVTEMLRPESTLLVHKAKAIITDEGGITSHAAIVSREFGKPCIVGTEIATKAIKEGDLVEIDFDKEVVRILKKEH